MLAPLTQKPGFWDYTVLCPHSSTKPYVGCRERAYIHLYPNRGGWRKNGVPNSLATERIKVASLS